MFPNTFFYPPKNYQQNFSSTKINTTIIRSNTSFIVTSSKLFGFSFKDSLRIGVGMIARGEVALIVTEKGIAGGLLDVKYRAMVVLLVLVSSLLAPIILKLLYKNDDVLPLSKPETEEGHYE